MGFTRITVDPGKMGGVMKRSSSFAARGERIILSALSNLRST
ncbi:MAG: hypothetical protein QHH75_06905 [Bacillota bacterium]|nr:hypothetical protein [Bacillota bacterium]